MKMNAALAELLSVKISSTAKILALHLARVLENDEVTTILPRIESDVLKISRNEYERAYREVFKCGWVKTCSPTKVVMALDALPRRALAGTLVTSPSVTAKQESLDADWTRDHSEEARGTLRGGAVSAPRTPRAARSSA